MNKLEQIFAAITAAETKLIPVFVTNPQSQALAGIAFVGEQVLFNLISSLHAQAAAAPVANAGAAAPAA